MIHDALVDTEWLAAQIGKPHIRIIDCTTHMQPQPVGPSKIVSGHPDYIEKHLPGAHHVDMVKDLSDPEGQFPYTAIDKPTFNALMQRLGIASTDHVVLYGQSGISTMTRAWFIFYLHGQQVSILDGGLRAWQAAGLPIATGVHECQYNDSASPLSPKTQPEPSQARHLIANRETVQAALERGEVQLVNALSQAQFLGTGGAHYGRPGRIPTSLNLPAKDMVDPETGRFWDLPTLRDKVNAAAIRLDQPAIHYCGGGIAATTSAFVMHLLGATDWSIYDDSLLDWSNQRQCPMDCG